jgi:hypothetical protein
MNVEKLSDDLPIVDRASIDKETLIEPVTVEGSSMATDDSSILMKFKWQLLNEEF